MSDLPGLGSVRVAVQVWYLIRELPSLKQRNDTLLKQISVLDTKIGIKHADTRPLCAFVTFSTQSALVQALTAYKYASPCSLTRLPLAYQGLKHRYGW